MVAFVNDDVAIIRNKVLNHTLSVQALDYGNVYDPRSFVLSSSKLAYVIAGQRKKGCEALTPLVHELSTMYKN